MGISTSQPQPTQRRGHNYRPSVLSAIDAKRAQRAQRMRAKGSAWHRARARTLETPLADLVAACGQQRRVVLRCDCETWQKPIPCGQHRHCHACARERAKAHGRRAWRVWQGHLQRSRERWVAAGKPRGKREWVYLLTYTFKRNEDESLSEALKFLQQSWKRWHAWLHWRVGYSPVYLAGVECTERQRGHVHLHVAMLLPYLPFREAQRAWESATDGRAGPAGWHAEHKGPPERCADVKLSHYCVKYATKGARLFSVLAAEWEEASYGKRLLRSSDGFWEGDGWCCSTCGRAATWVGVVSDRREPGELSDWDGYGPQYSEPDT